MERETREEGRWRGGMVALFPGYFIALTNDPAGLQQEILGHTYPVYVAGKVGSGYAPMAQEAEKFLTSVMDRHHIVRMSRVSNDERDLRVTSGPLMGLENRIARFDCNERQALVRVCAGAQGTNTFSLAMPLYISQADEQMEDVPSPRTSAKRADHSLPLSRRTPKGRLRWYLVECPEGQEEPLCRAVREAVSHALLEDAYVPKTEVIRKVHGEWTKPVRQMFAGRFAVATCDAAALSVCLSGLGLPVRLAGGEGGDYAPVDDKAWQFFESCMDGTRTIRESRGEIVGNELRVQWGPLVGRESRVTGYVRRKSLAFVNVGEDASGSHSIVMPLAIVARR